jgi:magnesium transporter
VAAGLALGTVLGLIGMSRILVWQVVAHPYGQHYMLVGLTVAFSLLGVVTFGTVARFSGHSVSIRPALRRHSWQR